MNKSNSYRFLQWETWLMVRAAAVIPKSLPADHPGGQLLPGHFHFSFEKTQGWRGKDMNPVGEGHVLIWFSQNQEMHLPNDKALTIHQYIPITFPNCCSSLETSCNFKWNRTPSCQCKSKVVHGIAFPPRYICYHRKHWPPELLHGAFYS